VSYSSINFSVHIGDCLSGPRLYAAAVSLAQFFAASKGGIFFVQNFKEFKTIFL
jgi:hypothetical protein